MAFPAARASEAPEIRRRYGVPDGVRLRADARECLAWVEGAEEAVRTVAAAPDDLPLSTRVGRAPLRTLPCAGGPLVVREYRKGGLLRGVRGRRFRGRWRPLDELVLHRRLASARVPVPEAVGAVVRRGAVGWRGFLLLREVDRALDLETFLYAPEAHPEWPVRDALAEAGRSVRALHDAGVSHADLHPKNLLLDPSTAHALVIDLDRARAFDEPLDEEARLANLVRLGRAVEKHRLRGMRVGRRAALRFLAGYGGSDAEGRRWLDLVRPRLARALSLRVLWWRLTGQAEPRRSAASAASSPAKAPLAAASSRDGGAA